MRQIADMKTESVAIEPYSRQSLPTSRDILAVLFRQRWTMLIAFAVAVAAVAISGLWIPKYEGKMKILVRRQRSDAIVTSSTNAPSQIFSDQVSEEDLNSEVELLNSDDILRKVVIATGLSAKPGASNDPHASEVRVAKAVQMLSKDLKIEPLRKSNVISVSYQNRDPQTAANVLQVLSAAYTEKHLQVHRSSGEFKFFDQQMAQYQQGLNAAQAKLKDFTKGTGVVSADTERDAALRQADEFDTTARQAQTALLETQQRASVLRGQLQSMQPRMTTLVRNSDNPQLLEQLKATLLNLQMKRTELLTKYEPTYRLVQEVDQELKDTQNAITAAESKPLRDESTDQNPDYQWVRGELTKAQAELSGLKARASSASSIAAKYRQVAQHLSQEGVVQQDLQRSAKTQEDNYYLYLQKREEARISDALDQRGILNVAMAEQPVVPALPTKSPLGVAVLTLLLVGTFSLSAAFVVDFMDPSFRTADELANYLGTPVLASLPKGTVLVALTKGGE
jgi:uncharacterized protein involved in exopolysaccharide biosynthesis